MDNQLNLLEQILRTMIKEAGLKPTVIALHNACVHGEIFSCTDKELKKLFGCFEKLIKITKKMDE